VSRSPAVEAAEAALAGTVGGPVRLGTPALLKSWERNDVWRCPVLDDSARLGPAVVVKHFKSQPDRGLDDWASLQFVSGLALDPPLAPTFLAGDRAAAVFVMSDLGPARPWRNWRWPATTSARPTRSWLSRRRRAGSTPRPSAMPRPSTACATVSRPAP
jgi:hypothetical protein